MSRVGAQLFRGARELEPRLPGYMRSVMANAAIAQPVPTARVRQDERPLRETRSSSGNAVRHRTHSVRPISERRRKSWNATFGRRLVGHGKSRSYLPRFSPHALTRVKPLFPAISYFPTTFKRVSTPLKTSKFSCISQGTQQAQSDLEKHTKLPRFLRRFKGLNAFFARCHFH